MPADFINIVLAFLEGLGLILSPCILPILPIILSGSLDGSKKRPFGIIVGFILSFALFTFFSRKLVQATGIDLELIRHLSYGLLILFGIVMMSTFLTDKFTLFTQRLLSTGSRFRQANNPEGGFIGGMLFGFLVGIIWTPCAGPILAAVIVQSVIQQSSFISFLTILSFGIGVGVPLFLIAVFGRTIVNKLAPLKNYTITLRKILGAIIILAVFYMIYHEVSVTSFARPTEKNQYQAKLINGVINIYRAPPISGISHWINSPPLSLGALKGKVVLIDFWTYSCINCLRSIPYLNDWYEKYHDQGLEIIGVHSPEFEFEKNLDNVKNAVIKNKIAYPVALDNQFATWLAFQNRYWPAHYLIDKKGEVVYQHFGEGEYDMTENNIRFLLGIPPIDVSTADVMDISLHQTPETYLGSARSDRFMSPEMKQVGAAARYRFPESLAENQWALEGEWIIYPDKIISAKPDAKIKIHFYAGKVFVVMGSSTKTPIQVKVLLDDKPQDMNITVDKHTLYPIIDLPHPTSGLLELNVLDPGLEIYTFTFGS
jgi:cytochrome c biogenesis protein CcdA/thiol-disulfide isomerase/thioredoxin